MPTSYSYAGEDLVALELLGDTRGTYLDIGANHPTKANNTYLFYELGWSGVCVEPVPRLAVALARSRPRDLVLELAASDRDGRMTLHEPAGASGLATLCPGVAHDLERDHYRLASYEVEVRTLRSVAAEWRLGPPDLISLDVEGHERQVLDGTPFDAWRPRVLIIESTVPRTQVPSEASWEPPLLRLGYRLHAQVGINRIYSAIP
ncbi:hypothetical protein OJF2_08790 [Aquisphaera giovannonii]|uniref:Methyltransferase FkbM domain-containing protein n=1 Tax=Aquisphaera giovannonii TaxID=406548 RepID=A0A5B9VWE9_9BACT|nr:FkbM family methyltransferase [Aquisphaera giovannonii]QEH32409.1 hypothetical protein OJF2_08790 [Aquisphaera giovannonii]